MARSPLSFGAGRADEGLLAHSLLEASVESLWRAVDRAPVTSDCRCGKKRADSLWIVSKGGAKAGQTDQFRSFCLSQV